MRILGGDVSLNHSGFVCIDGEGKLVDHYFLTGTLRDVKANPDNASRWKQPVKEKDKDLRSLYRLAWLDERIGEVYDRMKPDFIVLEGYAFDTHGAHQMGEVGGLARLLAWRRGVKLRCHDPLTLKMFAAHKGNASKEEVQAAVKARWNPTFGTCSVQSHEDLNDAYVLAMMGLTEVLLRNGERAMNELHPKELQVFNRTTRAAPINVLGRGWIQPLEGE